MPFKCSKIVSTAVLCKKQNLSSAYLFQNLTGEGEELSAASSMYSMKMFATTGETGELMAAPSVCS